MPGTSGQSDNIRSSRRGSVEESIKLSDITEEFSKLWNNTWKKEIDSIVKSAVSTSIKAELTQLKQKVNNQEKTIQSLNKYIYDQEVEKLKTERHNRSCNIVIQGIDEATTADEQTNATTKVKAVLNYLNLGQIDIDSISRIGTRKPGSNRPIKVVFEKRETRNEILMESKKLRNSQFPKVYISSDKCKVDRDEDYRLRLRAKSIRENQPTAKVIIRKNQLFVDGTTVDSADPLCKLPGYDPSYK